MGQRIHIGGVGQVVGENFRCYVPQVLLGEGTEDGLPSGIVVFGQEGGDHVPIASGGLHQVPPPLRYLGRAVQSLQLALPVGGAGGQHGGPLLLLGRSQQGGVDGGILGGGHGKVLPIGGHLSGPLQFQGEGGTGTVPLRRHAVQLGLHVEVPQTQLHLGLPRSVGGEGSDGVEAGLIEDLDVDRSSGGRQAVPHDLEGVGPGVGVTGRLVVPGHRPGGAQQSAVEGRGTGTEQTGVDQNSSGGGGVEPPTVQNRLRLAGPQKAPLTVTQGFYPGVVIVTVSPAGGVDLPGGNAHAAQGGHQESRLLTAPAAAVAEHRQGGGGAVVLELIGGLLMAPAVYRQHSFLIGGQTGYPLP